MKKVLLLSIVTIAFLVRVPLLDQYPAGFTPDEASFGYDAYSLLLTGRDQWGKPFPLVLESFGDFKAPLYSYILVPFVWIFGLEKWVVRLPNALFGVGAVYVIYLLVNEIQEILKREKKFYKILTTNYLLPTTTAFLLAISPWHIQLSRGAFEANMTVFFLPLALYFFIRGLREYKYFPLFGLIFSLNLFTYHSAKLVTPLLFVLVGLLFNREILKVKRKYLALCALFVFTGICLTLVSFQQGAARRAADVNIFNGALEAQAEERLRAIEGGMDPSIAKLFHNQYWIVLKRFTTTYFKLLSQEFLFVKGPGETTYGMVPGMPVLYPIEVLFLIAFLILLVNSYRSKALWIIAFAILIAPIPSGLTTGVGYAANRVAIMMPFIQIALSLGAIYLVHVVSQKVSLKFGKFIYLIFVTGILINFFYFARTYIQEQPIRGGKGMLVGRLEIAEWLKNNDLEYDKVIISRRLSEPHMYIAFAKKWNPHYYQANTIDWHIYKDQNLRFLDQLYSYSLGKYTFKAIESQDFQTVSHTLIVVLPDELPKEAKVVYSINYPNGEPSLYVVDPAGNLYAKAH